MNYPILNAIINKICLIKNDQQQEKLLKKIDDSENSCIISFVNAHSINLAFQNEHFSKAILASDILLRDGIGVKLLFKYIGLPVGINMNGTDFIPKILNQNTSKKISLYGTTETYLIQAKHELNQKQIEVISFKNGFLDTYEYLTDALKYKPEIIILAMGMPKQEQLAIHLKQNLPFKCVIINGGAIVDFIGGKVKRAPKWMRQIGLEWLFRLLNEPRRLFKRYAYGNLLFLARFITIKHNFIFKN